MNEIKARETIPVAWAENGRCPLCSAPKMQVQKHSGGADQLRCSACELAFEVESGGTRMRITNFPDKVGAFRNTVSERWITAAELRLLTQQISPSPGVPIPVQKLTRSKVTPPDEMVIRARKLRNLGNSPAQIQAILSQTETDPDRIQAAMQVASQMERQDQIRQRKRLRVSMFVIGAIVVICVGAGTVLQKMVFSKQTGAVSPLQETLVPDLAKILNLSTPVVQYNTMPPGSSSEKGCPHTAKEASALFGGQEEKWSSPPRSNGWVMINTSEGSTIYTPSGMTAAYLQLGSNVVLVEVLGPATLSNVYYIAISCP
jgi:hypothetical protein